MTVYDDCALKLQAPTISREDVVREARKMRGTPYRHLGRAPGRGLDCIGLLFCVAKALGQTPYMPGFNYIDYVSDGYVIDTNKDSMISLLSRSLIRIDVEERGVGDIEGYWIRHRRIPCHTAILTDRGHLHSVQGKRVLEQPRSGFWDKRLCGAFRYPGVRS